MKRLALSVALVLIQTSLVVADVPKIESKTYHSNINGWDTSERIYSETHTAYRYNRHTRTSKKEVDPEHVWETSESVGYYEARTANGATTYHGVKDGIFEEHHNLMNAQPHVATTKSIGWFDADGIRVNVECLQDDGVDGRTTFHYVSRFDTKKDKPISISLVKAHNGDVEYSQGERVGNMDTVPAFEDTSQCSDPGFPFEILKGKPPVY